MQVLPNSQQTAATALASGAVSLILLLSLAVAIFEVATAIKRKITNRSDSTSKEDDRAASSLGDNSVSSSLSSDASSAIQPPQRKKKCSLPEFTWMRHVRQRNADSSSTHHNHRHSIEVIGPPPVFVSACSDVTSVELKEPFYSDALYSATDRLTVEDYWCPVSHLKQSLQVRPARFAGPCRRTSSPEWVALNRNGTSSMPSSPRFRNQKHLAPLCSDGNNNSNSRRSYAGMTHHSVLLPLTPGVARLCGSLSDISESATVEAMDCAVATTSASARPYATALETRLNRMRPARM